MEHTTPKKHSIFKISVVVILIIIALALSVGAYFSFKLYQSFKPSTPVIGEEEIVEENGENQDEDSNTAPEVDKNPYLTKKKKKMVESVGIDPANLPTTITPEMQQCFIDLFGEQRVNEIINGAEPTAVELARGASCL